MNTKLFLIIVLFITITITLFYYIDLETNIIILLSILIILLFNKEHFKLVNIDDENIVNIIEKNDSSIMKLQENQDKKIDYMIELINKYNKAQRIKINSKNSYPTIEVFNSCITTPASTTKPTSGIMNTQMVIDSCNSELNLPSSFNL